MIKLFVVLLLWWQSFALANEIKILVGFPPGGGQYLVANLWREAALRAQVDSIIITKPGAGGIVGMNECVQIKDSNTICMATQAQYVHAITVDNNVRRYDPKQLIYLKAIGSSPTVLVTSIKNSGSLEFHINRIKTEKVTFASGALGLTVSSKLLFTALNSTQGAVVEYKGTGPAIIDVIGNHVDYALAPWAVAKAEYEAGRIHVVMSLAPSQLTFPTIQSIVPDFMHDNTVFGFVVGNNRSNDDVVRLTNLISTVALDTSFIALLRKNGIFSVGNYDFAGSAELERIQLRKILDLK